MEVFMSLKFKLMSVIIVIILSVIVILSVFTISRSSSLLIDATYQYAGELAEGSAIELQRRIEVFSDYGNVLSLIFSDFETTPEFLRRDSYDDFMRSTIQQNASIMGIWTAWLPDTIDSYDAERGQYQTFYTRRQTGYVEHIPEGYNGWRNYLANIESKPVLASPVWRDTHGYGNVAIISIMFPIKNSGGALVGLVGINYVSDMQEIVDDLVKLVYEGKGVAAVYANDGVIVAHYDRTHVRSNIRDNIAERELLGDQHNRVVQSIINGGENGKAVTLNRHSDFIGTDLHIIFRPVKVSGVDTPWSLMLGIPMNEITRPVREMTMITIIFAVIILAVAAIITFFFARNIVKPIISVTHTLRDISEGEGDLTKRIINNSKDEVGELSRYFNLTLDKIKNLVIKIKNEATKLSEVGTDLASNMNQTAAAVNEIVANIQSIKSRVINQSASVSQTHATMEQLTGNINRLGKHVEDQSDNIAEASAAIEEMVANVQSVTKTLINNNANVKALQSSSEVGRSGLSDVARDIKEIANESQGLLEINSVMANIASQTNLLSMNAAIEAAHAGEAGRGFAVVADEIRKLAESSSAQSKTISAVLKKIKTSIDKIMQSTENVLNKFGAIDSSVRTVAEQEESIRNAMEEQGTGSKQILEGIGNVNDITKQVKGGSGEMLAGAKEVIQESDNLEKMTQEISSGMSEMATGADQINEAVLHVSEISIKTREGIDTLMKEVSRFKVE